ncbi:MAG: dihydroorotase [Bacteroidales bacterium]|jgi:dihydroorotase|nr:dihydroorotase [Bacteroidales bacterium]
MSDILIQNPLIINEGISFRGDVLVSDEIISAVALPGQIEVPEKTGKLDASGLILIPGVIDDHVHFREPGLSHKGDIFTETRAAVAGGITSFMDMPNTVPQTISNRDLEHKFRIGSEKSLINYSFYIGATENNLDEIMNTDPARVCGIKLFMGASTGNMLVSNENSLRELFKKALIPLAVHCEDETTIRRNTESFRKKYGDDIPMAMHPLIRSRDACFKSSSLAVRLAREYNTRLHVLHLSTADEMKLFSSGKTIEEKRITGEACVHHLWFDDSDYEKLGSKIRWNPAIKTIFDRKALTEALNSDVIDVIGTDHAPHTLEEKSGVYLESPSGAPMVQHSLTAMLELWHRKIFSLEKIVEKMCHNPAVLFNISKRGFIREGYKADLVLIDPDHEWMVSENNILYKCGWSPFEGLAFRSKVVKTFVNGNLVYNYGEINNDHRGRALSFDR